MELNIIQLSRIKNSKYCQIILIMFITFIACSNTFRNDFNYDDNSTIIQNYQIRHLENIPDFFISPFRPLPDSLILRQAYRPLVMASFAINYRLGGYNVTGYHVVNSLFHIANAVLVYLLVILLLSFQTNGENSSGEGGNARSIAFFTALLFAVHPVNTQAINQIWQRSVLMVSFFYLLSVILLIRCLKDKKPALLALSVISYILALSSKETAITLPFIIILLDWFIISNFNIKKIINNIKKYHFVFILIGGFYVFIRFFVHGAIHEFTGEGKVPIYNFFITQFRVIVSYLKLMVFPRGLSAVHVFTVSDTILDVRVIASYLAVIAVIIIAIRLVRVSRAISIFMLWFFITLIPTSTIFPLKIIMNEHRLYLPGIGLYAALIIILFSFIPDRFRRRILPLMLSLIIIIFSVLTLKRNAEWRDGISLWSSVLRLYPESITALNNRGISYRKNGFIDEALADFNRVVELNPGYSDAYNNRGLVYTDKRRYDEAITNFNRVLEMDPENSEAHNNRGIAYMEKGIFNKALNDYNRALELNTKYLNAYCNRGAAYLEQGLMVNALADFEKAIEIDSNYSDAYNNRGNVFMKKGNYDRALADYNLAIKKDSGNAKAYNNRGIVYSKKGLFEKEIADYSRAVDIDPWYMDAYLNRGIALLEKGYNETALADFNRVISIDAGYSEAYVGRGIIQMGKGFNNKAIADFDRAIELNPQNRQAYINRNSVYKKMSRQIPVP